MRLQVHICTVTSQVDYKYPLALCSFTALRTLAAAPLGAAGLCYSSAVSVRGHLITLPMSPSVRAVYLHLRCTCACRQKRCKPTTDGGRRKRAILIKWHQASNLIHVGRTTPSCEGDSTLSCNCVYSRSSITIDDLQSSHARTHQAPLPGWPPGLRAGEANTKVEVKG